MLDGILAGIIDASLLRKAMQSCSGVDRIGPAHAGAVARATVREVLAEAAEKTNDLDDAARLPTAARLAAVLRVVASFPELTVETPVDD